jgi:hypothetical protein
VIVTVDNVEDAVRPPTGSATTALRAAVDRTLCRQPVALSPMR